ncbi:drug/metabolite transporter (DMT)-like permease [Desulfobaculum xiamenense]|uniref:Drug/metabolite transporter (DMT)-like permease n=1 Tax=Desulfobaculum xiamenense TaxID=995050 RepID=A0A846QID2_9BACT|nr:DMT family transporter [Desulfobaculum xiamenense]NJB68616.1 drug/metabolite transporter (DMT)-like permease [Desulfobaculum xiamenense]
MTGRTDRARLFPFLTLLLAVLLWSSSFIAMKIVLRSFDPYVMIFGRLFIASIALLPFLKLLREVRYQPGDWKYLCFMALCEPCLYFVFESNALRFTSASQAGMVTATLPLLVAVAAVPLLNEKISRSMMAGFVMAVGGVVWLSLSGEACEGAPNPALGNTLEGLAMCAATGYIVTLKRLSFRYSPHFLTGFQAVAGATFFLPLLFLPSTVLPTHFPLDATLSIVYLGLVVTLGAYGMHNYAVSKIPASKSTAFINLIPVFTVIMGWLILDERFTPQQFAASALVLAGVIISQRRDR